MICFEDVVVELDQKGARQLYINAAFEAGDFVLIVGPNGSGKTSFLDLIAGVRPYQGGSITGLIPDLPVAYAVQEPHGSLLPWRSILSNILLPSHLSSQGEGLITEARELLNKFGLLDRADDFPYTLSGGEKQAINFIRTICTPAYIRLFDEVTASLHSSFKSVARDILPENRESTTTFFISHDSSDFILPFNRFFAIQRGSLKEISKDDAKEVISHV
ncbi:MAG: ATP-binding cassette domain-containing protein [Candidatus Thiodiazotropha sp.]